ncbi:MAG: cbb3-type cytochrome c oxidase subunit I [Steroidobacteraceae bacterium]|jgi:cytochrome c oxidase cbb3-type subunit 1
MQSPAARLGVLTGGKPWGSQPKPADPVMTNIVARHATPDDAAYHPFLVKFLLISALSLLIGTMHGMLQVMPPIRAWLDSIGSPYGGPGHMIDPLAHAHMNLVGGVVMLIIGVTYYLLPILSGRPLYSLRLIQHSFWLMTVGVYGFYAIQMTFGIWEGNLLLNDPAALPAVHHWYGRLVAIAGTMMAGGFLAYFFNIALTMRPRPRPLPVARISE